MVPMVRVPLPYGEIVDRLVILDLKRARIRDPDRRHAAAQLRDVLARAWLDAGLPDPATLPEYAALIEVNGALWDTEDALRDHEVRGDFGPAFVARARSVYVDNDRRAALKATLDARLGSPLTEPKEHLGKPLQSTT